MRRQISEYGAQNIGIDAEVGHRLIEVKRGVRALRSIRMGLVQLAYAMAERPQSEGFLVLPDVAVTQERLQREWQLAASVLRPEMLDRLSLCVVQGDHFKGIPRNPDRETERILMEVAAKEKAHAPSRSVRSDASFIVLKVLLYHWLTKGTSVTTNWLTQTTGYSYPTVALTLQKLGSLIERQSDRSVRLRWFPREDFARLIATANRVRSTVRFGDRSGQPRSSELHLRRLEKLDPPNLAIGGVVGAAHYFPDLDLVGIPRLDLSLHCPRHQADLGFIEKLDPALKRIQDPLEPANVVVHVVRHQDPLFTRRENGLTWADPVECLLDLHEAGLEAQASQFLKALQKNRPSAP